MPDKLIENRQIRVFISSTFRDMQDERDELMKKTFPMLRRKAAERDVTLTELDLRWGITPEESENGKVVEICLREIENSVPFFIGIIGNRYGWIPGPDDLGESLRERYSQVNGYVARQLSVTEMEMQFGVLERPEDMHAYFFIKEQEMDDVDEPVKLAALKKAVRENERYPVSTYSSPEDLAGQVEAAFTKLLDELFPEGNLSELEKERVGQRAYLNSLCQNYIRTESNFAAIDEWMEDWEKHQLVITGASGLGKSALVANWVSEKLAAGENLPYKIIYHFVGNGGSLGSHGHVIKVLCDEIRDRYGFGDDEKEAKTDEKALEELVNKVAAEGDKPLLIVLDAINQIIDVDNSKQLNWLPIPPKHVKILFTTLEDDQTMAVFKNRHYPVFTLKPLTKAQRGKMVRQYLGLFSKKLQPCQVEQIISDKQCKNTLVLKTLLDELVNFGIFEKLDEKIDTYLGTASVEDFYGILLRCYEADFGESLARHILSLIAVSRNGLSEEEILAITKEVPLHWSQFFCAIRQHLLVKNGLISFAHSYIRKAVEDRCLAGRRDWEDYCRKEIVALLKDTKSHRAMDEVPYQYDILEDIPNLHKYLMDLEVFEYLNITDEIVLGKYWRELIDNGFSFADYLNRLNYLEKGRWVFYLLDLSTFTRTTLVIPPLSLVFIEKALGYVNKKEIPHVYTELGLSYGLSGDYKKSLLFEQKALSTFRKSLGENNPYVADAYNNVGATLSKLGDYQKSLNYLEKSLSIRQRIWGENHLDVANSFNNLSVTYSWIGNYRKALKYGKKALEARQIILGEDHPEVANSYNNIGATYGEAGNYKLEIKYQKKALEIRQRLFGESHPDVAASYNNLGTAYKEIGNHKKALLFLSKALDIRQVLFGENHSDVANSLDNIGCTYRELGGYQKAIEYGEKALRIRLSIFGEIHPDVATSYNNLGVTYGELGCLQKELFSQEKALSILQQIYGETNPHVATLYDNIGVTYGELGNYQKALEFVNKALEIRRGFMDENHPDMANSYNNIGVFYGELGEYQKALGYAERALKICLCLFGETHPDVANSYTNIGFIHRELGNLTKALDNVEKALKISQSLYGENHPDVATLFNLVGIVYGELGEKEKELGFRLRALEIAKQIKKDDDIAVYLNCVGNAYKSAGKKEMANDYFRQAAEKYRELGDEEQAQENLALIEE